MTASTVNDRLDSGDFAGLFIEDLGWQAAGGSSSLSVETIDGPFAMRRVAHYRGIGIWVGDGIPSKAAQRAIDFTIAKESVERLVIFTEGARQLWLWPQSKDAAGAGATRLVPHEYIAGSANEALRQRLGFIRIGIDDEVSLLEMKRRLRRAFDSDPVTKKFYREFAKEHGELMASIEGIDPEVEALDLRWYGSILLNRLMFIYFMQRKRFLDDDVDYLRNRLQRIRQIHGPDEFYGFYRDFLLPLFHEGLGSPASRRKVDPKIAEILGDIPYINGGIFAEHELERTYEISIADDAFEKLFDFFDQWQWHLDDRPTGNANEINPDVLGYIFEQFVNNRADNGVYYTKEDVTGYMTSNTLIPVFLERLIERTGVNPWLCLMADPDRYIWSSIAHGSECDAPAEIIAEAETWPRPAWDASRPGEDMALPSESWWEVMDRRCYHQDLQERMRTGGVDSVSDAVTANIDLETLAVDVIDRLDNPDDVLSAWNVLTEISVLDPTCGSGAFLFAALKIFDVLYDAVLDAADKHLQTSKHKGLRDLVKRVDEHPNRSYFVLKHATLSNLYGVDLMPEAVEIARLRLFLKLVSQVDDRNDVEPLPDLEFNIKSGNALVGASNAGSVSDAVDLLNATRIGGIIDECQTIAILQKKFSEAQLLKEPIDLLRVKLELVERANQLRDTLDVWWMKFLGSHTDIDSFRLSNKPFHWFVEFPEIFSRDGFDVIIGNPPYVAKPSSFGAQVDKFGYAIDGFVSGGCPDIYAQCLERAISVTRPMGRFAMIVPLSLSFSDDFLSIRKLISERFAHVRSSTFGVRPSGLFSGVQVRCTIVLAGPSPQYVQAKHFASNHNIWTTEYRSHLVETLRYAELSADQSKERWFKIGEPLLVQLVDRMRVLPRVESAAKRNGSRFWWKPVARYWFPVSFDCPPTFDLSGTEVSDPNVRNMDLHDDSVRDRVVISMAGKIGYFWWSIVGDDLNVPKWIVESFPLIPENSFSPDIWSQRSKELRERMSDSMMWNLNAGKWVGNYDLRSLTSVLDQTDREIIDSLGGYETWIALETWYRKVMKATGDPTGSIRGPRPPIAGG
ncbi:MAG: hypothetical protein K9H34_08510 [Actinomycetia bacterium]|nr:hypothetical protein [Actinomycetes bacterium]